MAATLKTGEEAGVATEAEMFTLKEWQNMIQLLLCLLGKKVAEEGRRSGTHAIVGWSWSQCQKMASVLLHLLENDLQGRGFRHQSSCWMERKATI